MSKLIKYNEACDKIKSNNCEPLFTEKEWQGVRRNKKIMKYWFKDKNGHPFYTSYDIVARGQKVVCNECSKILQNRKERLSEEKFNNYKNKFIKEKNVEILSDYKEYKNFRGKLDCKCLICGIIFKESIDNLLKKDSHGCSKIPKGELLTISYFEKNGIDYQYQVYIKELNLTSDFEIKLKNNKVIHLEIDGDQHYDFPNQFHHTYFDFLKSQERDLRKDKWYSDNKNINIHIRFNIGGKKNEDLEKILSLIVNGEYGICKKIEKNENVNINKLINISPRNKKIIAYSLDGNFFKIYESILQAEKELKIDKSTISACVNHSKNAEHAGNYIFKLYEKNFPKNISPYKNKRMKPVLIYSNDKLVDELDGLVKTAIKYNIPKSSLCRYLNNKGNNPSLEFDFKYKNNK